MRTCSPDSEPRYMHSGPKGKSEPCVHRESPTGRVIIVIVAEREDKRGKREREKRREERRGEEKEGQTERRERARKTEKAENPSVCAFKTPPCVPGKRPHVLDMRAFSRYTRRRLERTHGGVLNLHTEGFSACQPHHTKQHNTTQNTTPPTKHTSHAHNHVNTHTHHTYTYTYTYTYTHVHIYVHTHVHTTNRHTTHTTPHHTMHNRQPTVILRRKSECLNMCTAVNRPWSCTREKSAISGTSAISCGHYVCGISKSCKNKFSNFFTYRNGFGINSRLTCVIIFCRGRYVSPRPPPIGRVIWILMLQEAVKTSNESNWNPILNYRVQGDLSQSGEKKPWNVPSLIATLLIKRNMIMSQI